MTQSAVLAAILAEADPAKAAFYPRYFKTGPGQYGEGDKFLGVNLPKQRLISKQFKSASLKEIGQLLTSDWHEARLTGLFIMVLQFKSGTPAHRKAIYEMYISHSGPVGYSLVHVSDPRKSAAADFWGVNNWDLVDSSAMPIVGGWLADKPDKMKVLTRLARSDLLWERRIAIIATGYYIGQGSADEALQIAELLMQDKHDLIHKAVGWMLREVGKRVDRQLLLQFLDTHAATMPRTTLRYAIEHLPPEQRQVYMSKKK